MKTYKNPLDKRIGTKRKTPAWNKGLRGAQVAWNKGLTKDDPRVAKYIRLGRVFTKETRLKMSAFQKANPNSGRFKFGHQLSIGNKYSLGAKHTEEWKKENSIRHKGEKNWNWKGGVTPINEKIRKSPEYRDWRTAVFKRDDYTCVLCKSRGYKLNADHIKPFAFYPELRLVIENGRTLCVPCHRKTNTWGRPKSVQKKSAA